MFLKRTLLSFGLCFFSFLAFAQKGNEPFAPIVTSLEKWISTNPQEKIYLHTDKPYYLVGDTIWLKAYVTSGYDHKPSAISGAVYIDLINEGDSTAKTIKLPLMGGMAKGDFLLNDSTTREGNYRLRAYTQWMRNAGPQYFYDHTFSVGNSVANTVFAKIDYVYEKDGDKTKIKAVLKFTDESGKPYANNNVSFSLKESYKTLTAGRGKTDALGQITINIPTPKAETALTTYLVTNFNLNEDTSIPKTFPLKTALLKTDFQLFPEGGYLVNGVWSRVAFKATETSGLGADVKGIVIDDQQKEVAKIETKHLGMGFFNLMPEEGRTYSAKIKLQDSSELIVKLPTAKPEGQILSVYPRENEMSGKQSDTVLVRINTNEATLKKGPQQFSLVAQSGGKVYSAVQVNLSKPTTSVYLPLNDLPSGIVQITLFSAGVPLNERVFFLQRSDALQLKISEVAQKEYGVREKVSLQIASATPNGDAVSGNLSVAVISEDAVPTDETKINTIFSQLLLSADIKGFIEKPNYYFANPTASTRENLDLLMLTQGYRKFVWKDVLAPQQSAPAFAPEKITSTISGKITSLGKKLIVNGKVTLLNNKYGLIRDTLTNQQGRYAFNNLVILDGMQFTIQGRNEKGTKLVTTYIDQPNPQSVTPNPNTGELNQDIQQLVKKSLESSRELDKQLEKSGMLSRTQQLQEVKIRAKKKMAYGNTIKESQVDEIYRPDSRRPPCSNLMECISRMDGSRVNFEYVFGTPKDECGQMYVPMFKRVRYTVMIDGMTIDPCDYQTFFTGENPPDIDKIYFLHESKGVNSKASGGNDGPIMAVFTRTGNFRRSYDPSVLDYNPKGYDNAKEFYSPKYDGQNTTTPDLRSTVYWNPSVITGKEGKTEISFYNSDQTGNYLVVVEGINGSGLIGRSVYRYKVK
ncbi:hypothetical protein [Pedobacter paludis]|uniref:TonB-dependent receptor n=1 Tax=Pedobacter paludis TaxID=2203212 RepID=A0A317F3Q3_9SPHI|nr:hypothetical protein [Pedobacter paludis]PWS32469.1 hypothetical protein DF947_05120 [Pedobacter paludis]